MGPLPSLVVVCSTNNSSKNCVSKNLSPCFHRRNSYRNLEEIFNNSTVIYSSYKILNGENRIWLLCKSVDWGPSLYIRKGLFWTTHLRDLYFDIKPTPGSWHCFWFLLKMVLFWPKLWPSFTNTFPMWGKLFQIFLGPNKKKLFLNFEKLHDVWLVSFMVRCWRV